MQKNHPVNHKLKVVVVQHQQQQQRDHQQYFVHFHFRSSEETELTYVTFRLLSQRSACFQRRLP